MRLWVRLLTEGPPVIPANDIRSSINQSTFSSEVGSAWPRFVAYSSMRITSHTISACVDTYYYFILIRPKYKVTGRYSPILERDYSCEGACSLLTFSFYLSVTGSANLSKNLNIYRSIWKCESSRQLMHVLWEALNRANEASRQGWYALRVVRNSKFSSNNPRALCCLALLALKRKIWRSTVDAMVRIWPPRE